MKKIFFTAIIAVCFLSSGSLAAHAQMMDYNTEAKGNHTVLEEAEGREIWERLQSNTVDCQSLSDEDFGMMGEYFMGQMMGSAHSAMNEMMTRMHGEEGEEQIHVVLGKRLSGCDPDAAVPAQGQGWMPMMQMMWGGWSSPLNTNQSNNPMMYGLNNGTGWGFGFFGGIFMILWWVLVIAAVVMAVKWIIHQSGAGVSRSKSALDILKERYARGDIDKKEFEEKRKDLD
ncbi:MAG: SHOCT domain-containing protein [Candidatus Sungbacteria bacterium]|nr:SHOCT domain-containing protein [Candidatus Sungbacteria bacterium]